jgi:hypothetical protein
LHIFCILTLTTRFSFLGYIFCILTLTARFSAPRRNPLYSSHPTPRPREKPHDNPPQLHGHLQFTAMSQASIYTNTLAYNKDRESLVFKLFPSLFIPQLFPLTAKLSAKGRPRRKVKLRKEPATATATLNVDLKNQEPLVSLVVAAATDPNSLDAMALPISCLLPIKENEKKRRTSEGAGNGNSNSNSQRRFKKTETRCFHWWLRWWRRRLAQTLSL